MAIRIRSSFHAGGKPRSMSELASVIAMLGWKLAIDSIKRMREAEYDIDLGSAYFAGYGVEHGAASATVLESAMPSMMTAGALASSHRLAPDLAAALIGYGSVLALATLPLWRLLIG